MCCVLLSRRTNSVARALDQLGVYLYLFPEVFRVVDLIKNLRSLDGFCVVTHILLSLK